MTRYFVPAVLLLMLLCFNVEAATLFGRVVEVNDGDVITVFNLNRPVRIKLLAVDAPERDQAFGEVAKKHLSELVYDKSVTVEYSGIASDGSLVGRVTLNNVDVGAQMIRDGAAWFDTNNQDRLSASDREIYQQSESAARNEKRGLWQSENPIAPWEFVKAKTQRRDLAVAATAGTPAAKPAKRTDSELTNLTLMTARMNTAAAPSATSSASAPAMAAPATPASEAWARHVDPSTAWALDTSPKQWRPFKPAGEDFSVEAPSGGKLENLPTPINDGSGATADVNVYKVREGDAIYAVMWMKGPFYGEGDRTAIDQLVRGFNMGLRNGYQKDVGGEFSCDFNRQRKLSAPGYTAIEFDLTACTLPAKMRVFTRVVNEERRIYIGTVFYRHDEPNVSRFLNSFTVRR